MHATTTIASSRTSPGLAVTHSVWRTSIRFTLLTTLLFGIAYPLVVTGIAGAMFPHKAAGSLILKNGQVIGSELLAQSFTSDRYFHPRPSAAGNGYDPTSSGGSNLAQSNAKLVQRIQGDIDKLDCRKSRPPRPHRRGHHLRFGPRPRYHARQCALSGSAHRQGTRTDAKRRCNELIQQHTAGRTLGLLGEPRVNVLELNLALDKLSK